MKNKKYIINKLDFETNFHKPQRYRTRRNEKKQPKQEIIRIHVKNDFECYTITN